MNDNTKELLAKVIDDNKDRIKPCTILKRGDEYPRFKIPVTDRVMLVSNVTLFNDGVHVGYCGIIDASELSDQQFNEQAFANMQVGIRPDTKTTASNEVAEALHLVPYTVTISEGRAGRKKVTPKNMRDALSELAKEVSFEDFCKETGDDATSADVRAVYNFLKSK